MVVEFIGPPCVRMYTWPNTSNEWMQAMTKIKKVVGLSEGMVMLKNCWTAVCPVNRRRFIKVVGNALKSGKV